MSPNVLAASLICGSWRMSLAALAKVSLFLASKDANYLLRNRSWPSNSRWAESSLRTFPGWQQVLLPAIPLLSSLQQYPCNLSHSPVGGWFWSQLNPSREATQSTPFRVDSEIPTRPNPIPPKNLNRFDASLRRRCDNGKRIFSFRKTVD